MTKRLYRSHEKVLGGVCAGIAEYLGLDITLVRVAYLVLSVLTAFSGTIVYLVLWIVMPERP